MYLKSSFRHNPGIQNIAAYYRLVESYRNETDRVCHRTLLNIGFWPEATIVQKVKVVELLNSKYRNELALFEEQDSQVLVGGSFTATTSTVDLQVLNVTAVAIGNDLGLDDISINVC